ncbi:hypothetical protein [Flavobacterium sp. GT3R68]|uniref:hypothetical protein n=1 Tax=Flavobacterium sp. GT3R68 TaxID=2594437 RepID=UPI000F89406E|nr:hypothetical protein [Flavobacterium sp. GT3R68]RTY85776.1 hypothetical protein EKL32_28330 [Flavobacterium sp. GSN2]TRW90052.1 hypothetical protein FNW07_11370 [Flavobacterium sp. GT3R68]
MSNFSFKNKSLYWVFGLMLMAMTIRLKFHLNGNYLLAGVDGPYYPLQVRSLMDKFRLGISDMPLLFMLEAALAFIFKMLFRGSLNESILIAVKFVDIVIPPCAAIPVYLLCREFNLNKKQTNYPCYLMVGYSILNFTTVLLFSNNFQKNAVAVVFIFFYLYFVFRILKYFQKKDVYYAAFILLCCTLTHFGSAAILFFITIIILLSYALTNRQFIRAMNGRRTYILFIPVILFLSALLFFDSTRFERFINLPIRLFESPVILMMLDGQNIADYFNPINFFIPNLLAILAVFLFIRLGKTIKKEVKIFGLSLLIAIFILTSPLIGIEWANRLYMMSYVPIVIVYLILFSEITQRWLIALPVFIFCSLISIVVIRGYASPMLQSISNSAYNEFKLLKNKAILGENTVIVARQDLRILGSWEFRTKGVASYLLTKNDFLQFDAVFFLTQKEGINYTQEPLGAKLKIPANSIRVFQGDFFDLYKVNSLDKNNYVTGIRPLAAGIIINLEKDSFALQNKITGKTKTIIICKNTIFHLLTPNSKLAEGMNVEIWGKGIPFSLNLNAQTIVESK